jgi:hypothetical protein
VTQARPYLITSSILDAFDWCQNAPSSWAEKAFTDFKNQLFRFKTPLSPEVKRGMDFESKVCMDLFMGRDAFEGKHGALLTTEFYDKCSSGKQQEVTKQILKIDEYEYTLYGRMDIYFPGKKIIDIKTTGAWKGHSKYTARSQHPMYIATTGVTNFEYLVAVGSDQEVKGKKEWVVESVIPVDGSMPRDDAYAIIENKIRAFIAVIEKDPELDKAYKTIFSR